MIRCDCNTEFEIVFSDLWICSKCGNFYGEPSSNRNSLKTNNFKIVEFDTSEEFVSGKFSDSHLSHEPALISG